MYKMKHGEEIKTGIRKGFQNGTSRLAQRKCYGYIVSASGDLIINEQEAEVVKWIFSQYTEGKSLGGIAKELEQQGIASPAGKPIWSREALRKLLENEKYTGNVMLQKTADGKKNYGYEARYLYHDTHEAIISEDLFRAVQEEQQKRSRAPEAKIALNLKL